MTAASTTAAASANDGAKTRGDWRNIANGYEIPKEGYCDQPYVVITDDGNWLCVLTTGPGVEGDYRQHVISTISTDQGRTWSDPVDIEPPGPPEASWVMPLKVPSGRVYVFYNHNTDDIKHLPTREGKPRWSNNDKWVTPDRDRVDTLGHYVFKYSDDGGRTWSAERYEIPLRVMAIDRENNFNGEVLCFWGVGKPIIHDGSAYFGAAKVGGDFAVDFMSRSEGIFFRSDNVLTEPDPAKVEWIMLPDGDHGLRAPKGPIADEHNLVALSDGSLYCTYRTVDGFLCHAYSRDRGHTWTGPEYGTYTPGGRRIKHPRAANFVRKFSNGRFILWFHNHGGKYFMDRNPAWLCGGIERDGYIYWSQPEIVLYDDDPATRISYPDFIEQDGRYFITETQKTIARVHEIDPSLLEGMWAQAENRSVDRDGLVLELTGDALRPGAATDAPALPNLSTRGGFAIDLWITPGEIKGSQTIIDTRGPHGRGVTLSLHEWGALRLTMGDGRLEELWESDPGLLTPGKQHHVAIIVDGGPKIITFVVDGVLCDGGEARPKGWHRFYPALADVSGTRPIAVSPELSGQVHVLRFYNRYLRTSEAVGNFQAGLG